jgi:bile acid:Na+ symporter, BASS family
MTIDQAISILAAITLFELMVAIGLNTTFADVVGVARNWRLVGRAALANYVCAPAAAVLLLLFFQPFALDQANYALVAAGFLIAAVCPGAPYGPPFTGMARGNVGLAVGLMVILAGSSALLAPLLLQALLPLLLYFLPPLPPGSPQLRIDVVRMVGTLLVAQFLPLCVGLAVRQWRPSLAARLKRPANLLSIVLNLATLGVILTVQRDMLMAIPLVAFGGMLILVLAAAAAGWLLSEPGQGRRTAMVIATAVRNVGVAMVIATTSFPGTKAVAAATAFALFQTIAVALVALAWGRLASPKNGAPTEIKSQPAPTGAAISDSCARSATVQP